MVRSRVVAQLEDSGGILAGRAMPHPQESAPLVIGRYALHEKIASGGMANIYLGRLAGAVGFMRTVAIKRLHPHLAADPEFTTMFLDEARLAARVRHPNVIPTLDVVASQGELFLVMEYVEGDSLAELLRGPGAESVPLAIGASILSGVLQGLHAAHIARNDRGDPLRIVHRDVSPQNVIVGTDGVPRVFDFGIAKAIGKLVSTREGIVKGKLRYMAPEQILRPNDIDHRADIFAASVVLWEMLTRKALFDGENDGALVKQILEMPIAPPSIHNGKIPDALNDVVLRGLERDRKRRFASAGEMANALEDAIPGATPRKIGEWVSHAARERIRDRAAKVAQVEKLAPSGHTRAARAEGIHEDLPKALTAHEATTEPRRHLGLDTPSGAFAGTASNTGARSGAAAEGLTDDISIGEIAVPKMHSRGPLVTAAAGLVVAVVAVAV
jgi:serine/threonine-protein kinase